MIRNELLVDIYIAAKLLKVIRSHTMLYRLQSRRIIMCSLFQETVKNLRSTDVQSPGKITHFETFQCCNNHLYCLYIKAYGITFYSCTWEKWELLSTNQIPESLSRVNTILHSQAARGSTHPPPRAHLRWQSPLKQDTHVWSGNRSGSDTLAPPILPAKLSLIMWHQVCLLQIR